MIGKEVEEGLQMLKEQLSSCLKCFSVGHPYSEHLHLSRVVFSSIQLTSSIRIELAVQNVPTFVAAATQQEVWRNATMIAQMRSQLDQIQHMSGLSSNQRLGVDVSLPLPHMMVCIPIL